MNVFVPVPDAALVAGNNLHGKLVPFNAGFVQAQLRHNDSNKPSNWVAECNVEQARARLFDGNGDILPA